MDFSVFINYRRSDSEGVTGRLYDRLEPIFSAERLFIDVDSIAKGDDFVAAMTAKVGEAKVILAVIGPNWLGVLDEAGERRLDDPSDPVRLELERALATDKIIIPVLLGKTDMPREKQLPDTLKPLARRNAERLSHESFAGDVKRLAAAIERTVVEVEARREQEQQRRAAAEAAERQEAERKLREAAEVKRARAKEAGRKKRDATPGNRTAPDQPSTAHAANPSPEVDKASLDVSIRQSLDRQEELVHWDFVKGRQRLDELHDHLSRWPDGVTARMTLALLEPLEWAALQQKPDESALRLFIEAFPGGDHRQEAERLLALLVDLRESRSKPAEVAAEKTVPSEGLLPPPPRQTRLPRWLVGRPPLFLAVAGLLSGALGYGLWHLEAYIWKLLPSAPQFIQGSVPGLVFGATLALIFKFYLQVPRLQLLWPVGSTCAGWMVASNVGAGYFQSVSTETGVVCGVIGAALMLPGVFGVSKESRLSLLATVTVGGASGGLLPLDYLLSDYSLGQGSILLPLWQAAVAGTIGMALQQQLRPDLRSSYKFWSNVAIVGSLMLIAGLLLAGQ